MRAFVLAAGFGTRMGPLGKVVPKPLMPLGGLPVVCFALEKLSGVGVREVVLNLHHGADAIQSKIGNQINGIHIHYSFEPEILGTAGGLKKVEAFLRETGEPFFVLNADAVSNADLGAALMHHQKEGFLATLILRQVSKGENYGLLSVDEKGRLCRFLDAESPEVPEGKVMNTMFTGQSVLSPEFLDHIPAGRACGISEEVYPPLINSGVRIGGILTDAYWADIGTPVRYLKANMDLLAGNYVPQFDWPSNGYVFIQGKTVAWGDGQVEPPVLIGENATFKSGAIAGPFAVIGSNAMLAEESIVRHTVVFPGGQIRKNSRLNRCIVGPTAVTACLDSGPLDHMFFLEGEENPIPF